jgi:hypothetical protein
VVSPYGRWLSTKLHGASGHAVAQLVEALRYKPEGRRFDGAIENFH